MFWNFSNVKAWHKLILVEMALMSQQADFARLATAEEFWENQSKSQL